MNDTGELHKKRVSMLFWLIPSPSVVIVLILFSALVAYIFWGVSRPNPRVTIQELRGLTPDQVISRLGPPRSDSRKRDPRNPTPSTSVAQPVLRDGTFDIEYDDAELGSTFLNPHLGHFYNIRFELGRVVKITRYGGHRTFD